MKEWKIKQVQKTFTWKKLERKYKNSNTYLLAQRTPFWSWKDRNVAEYKVMKESNLPAEQYMTFKELESYYLKQGLSLTKG